MTDVDKSIAFYSGLFGSEPSVVKADYAKWMLDDPRVNFAISQRGGNAGLNHLGIQVAFVIGVILAMPVILYQLIAFLLPALTRREKRYLLLFIPGGTFFFVARKNPIDCVRRCSSGNRLL